MAGVTDAKSRVALGREGSGEAQIFDTSKSLNAFTNLSNLYQVQAQQDKAEAKEEKEKSLKKFEDDFKYSDNTFKPFQNKLSEMVKEMQSGMIKTLASGQKYDIHNPTWKETQDKIEDIKSFAKKGRDIGDSVKQAIEQIKKLETTGEYNTADMMAEIQALTERSYQNIEEWNDNAISKVYQNPKHYNIDKMAEKASEKVKNLFNTEDEVIKSKYTSEVWQTKTEFSPFTKLKQNAAGKFVPDLKDGKIQMDTDNPAFMDFVEGEPQIAKWLTYKTDEAVTAGDTREREAIRKELAAGIFAPYQKNQTSRVLTKQIDNTNAFLDNQVQNAKLNWDKEKFKLENGGGEGAGDIVTAGLKDYANTVTGKADRFRGAATIDGQTYRVADAGNLLNGTIVKGKEFLNQVYQSEDGKTMFYSKKDKSGNPIKNPNTANGLFPLDESAKSSLYRSLISNMDIAAKDKTRLMAELQSTEAGTIDWIGKADKNLEYLKDTEFLNDETFVSDMKDISQKKYPKTDEGTAQFISEFNTTAEKYNSDMPLSMNGKKYKNLKFDTDQEMLQTNQLTLKGINEETGEEEIIADDLTAAKAQALAATFKKGEKKGSTTKTETPKTETKTPTQKGKFDDL